MYLFTTSEEFTSKPIEKFSSIQKGNNEYQWDLLFSYRLKKSCGGSTKSLDSFGGYKKLQYENLQNSY